MVMVQIHFCSFYEGRRPVRIIGFIFTNFNVMAHPRTPHRGMRIFPAEIFSFFCYTVCIFGVVPVGAVHEPPVSNPFSFVLCGRAMHAPTKAFNSG